jgi:site-specific DNA-cytosine methylase
MAGAKRRSPTSTLVTKHSIQNAGSILEGLPEKPKEIWSLREAIDALKDEITLALDRGYTYPEISQMLTTKGVEISASTLKYYLSSVKRQDPNAKPRRRRRTLGVGISADSLNLGVSDPVVPKKRGRKPKAVVEAAAAAAAAMAEVAVPKKRGRKPGVKNAATVAAPAAVKATRKPRVAKDPAAKKTAVKATATKKTAVKATTEKAAKTPATKKTAVKATTAKATATKKTATATKAKTGTGRGRRKATV